MAIVILHSFRILSARRDLPFQFDKSRNLSFSIVFGFKMIIFDKFIIFYRISIKFLSFAIKFLSNFYQILSNSIQFYCFRTIQYIRGIL